MRRLLACLTTTGALVAAVAALAPVAQADDHAFLQGYFYGQNARSDCETTGAYYVSEYAARGYTGWECHEVNSSTYALYITYEA